MFNKLLGMGKDMTEIKIGDKVFIRNIEKDEYWLQDIIYNNPKKLGLGDLIPLHKEKKQISGGRLDILLKDPNDDSMYEVEVMLGEIDPSHIIRAIEYWDNEKRKYPQRQHYCVLIAESFDRRYFNVIQILSQNIPMIAIQADLIQVDGELILHFSKILDVYVEPEDEAQELVASENTWQEKAQWTLKAAKKLLLIISRKSKNLNLNFTQSYISIMINGRNAYLLDKRTEPNSLLWFNVKDEERQQAISKLLEEKNIAFNFNQRYKDFSFIITEEFLTKHEDLIEEIHQKRFHKLEENDESENAQQ